MSKNESKLTRWWKYFSPTTGKCPRVRPGQHPGVCSQEEWPSLTHGQQTQQDEPSALSRVGTSTSRIVSSPPPLCSTPKQEMRFLSGEINQLKRTDPQQLTLWGPPVKPASTRDERWSPLPSKRSLHKKIRISPESLNANREPRTTGHLKKASNTKDKL